MFDPSPVLTGAVSQNTAKQTADVDPRRYTQWDRTASKVGDATMSFGDFLDMINPLQHIPVVSSVYREITGDKINPVARVAGDILYGAALGPASAIVGGISAIADSAMETETGHDVKGSVYAALFGDDKEQVGDGATMVAANTPAPAMDTATNAAPVAVADATPTAQVADAQIAEASAPKQTMTAEQAIATLSAQVQAPAVAGAPVMQLAQQEQQIQQGIPLARNKLAFGGAIAPAKSTSEQNMAMAITQSTGMHVGNTIYPNRIVGTRGIPAHVVPASAMAQNNPPSAVTTIAADPAPVVDTANASLPATPMPNAASMSIPPALADDASLLKALNAYRSTAAMGVSVPVN